MKKKFFAVALATTMVVSSIVPVSAGNAEGAENIDLTDGLIAEYLFDGDLKDSLSSKVAKAFSAWGDYWLEEGRDHDTHPGPMLALDSVRGNVVEMKGMWNNTGYLEFDTSYLRDLTDSFSVTMWAKGNNSKTNNNNCTDAMSLFNIRTKEEVNTKNCGFVSLDTSLYPFINDGFGNYKDRTKTELSLSTEDWMQVTMVIDAKNNCINTYVNGELRENGQLGGGTVSGLMNNIKNGYALQIGSYTPWWESWDFRGYVDDVRFYNKALSAEEVVKLADVLADESVVPTPTYAQYKKIGDNNYTVRIISEVAIDDLTAYNQIGFRCSKIANKIDAQKFIGNQVFKSIMANGKKVDAADGKYFVVLEITGVTKNAVLYAQLQKEKTDKNIETVGNEVTVNMANIIK